MGMTSRGMRGVSRSYRSAGFAAMGAPVLVDVLPGDAGRPHLRHVQLGVPLVLLVDDLLRVLGVGRNGVRPRPRSRLSWRASNGAYQVG